MSRAEGWAGTSLCPHPQGDEAGGCAAGGPDGGRVAAAHGEPQSPQPEPSPGHTQAAKLHPPANNLSAPSPPIHAAQRVGEIQLQKHVPGCRQLLGCLWRILAKGVQSCRVWGPLHSTAGPGERPRPPGWLGGAGPPVHPCCMQLHSPSSSPRPPWGRGPGVSRRGGWAAPRLAREQGLSQG